MREQRRTNEHDPRGPRDALVAGERDGADRVRWRENDDGDMKDSGGNGSEATATVEAEDEVTGDAEEDEDEATPRKSRTATTARTMKKIFRGPRRSRTRGACWR